VKVWHNRRVSVRARPPCRLFVLLAREAPVAVILRRGPSTWYHVIRWRTNTDRFEHGAWFRGRIYEERCDLSPDGELLLCFALQGRRWQSSYKGSWTAVSRAPWLHALALWPQGDTWGGGGRFLTNRKLVIWSSLLAAGQAHPDHPGHGLEVVLGAPTPEDRPTMERAKGGWSGRDQGGRPIHTSGGKLFRERFRNLVEIADFNDLSPDPQPPPDWAREPLEPARRRTRRRRG
jgi:hypothetical protein